MRACKWSRVIFDLSVCEGGDVISTDVLSDIDEHVGVGVRVDDVSAASEGGIF
jgi:hypothetical protein